MIMKELAEQIESQLRVATMPIAVKLLETEEDVPEEAVRPRRDLGYSLSTCQAFSYSRRRGLTVAQLKEDMWCPEPVIGYGLEEAPRYFLEGNNRYPSDVVDIEAGKAWASEEFPRLPIGKYIGVVSAPLADAEFDPDVILVYCNPAQMTLMLLAWAYRTGLDMETKLGGHSACVYSVVYPMQKDSCCISTPCGGDRWRAMAGDDEMIFSIPVGDAERMLEGLRYMEETGRKMPFGLSMQPEYPLEGSYLKIARMLGMDQVDKP
jgi:uncharacterized protein (DUF169 family)